MHVTPTLLTPVDWVAMASLPKFAEQQVIVTTTVNSYTHAGGGLVGRYVYFMLHRWHNEHMDFAEIQIWALKNIIKPTMAVTASSIEL